MWDPGSRRKVRGIDEERRRRGNSRMTRGETMSVELKR
jgi:hypothetical protein